VALASVVLALPRQTVGPSPEKEAGRATLRSLLNRWISLLALTGMLGYLGFTAIGFVLVLVAADEFGLGPGGRGVLVAGYGLGGTLFGRYAGGFVDRAGRPGTALWGGVACTAGVLGLAVALTVWSLGLVYFAVGCASSFVWAGLNTIAVESFPANRAGATSAYSAFKFVGNALGPLIYVPSSTPRLARRSSSRQGSRRFSPCSFYPGSRVTDEKASRRSRLRPGRLLP
jgi:MFS transporter, ACDE family, multidrug resistance protein